MDEKTCWDYGFDWGKGVASWVDLPEVGDELPPDVDWIGIGEISDESEREEAFTMMAGEAEMNARQFSPFEFMAKEINESDDPDACWQAFDEGVQQGIIEEYNGRTTY